MNAIKHSILRRAVRQALVAGAGLAALGPAVAQEDAGAIEEIVVTARQRAELLTDVPASVTAFTASDIEDAGIERPEDFIALTPGVTLVNTAEAGDLQVNIRGINTSRDAETNFALIIDGVLYTNPNAFNQEFADIQQIEVLKGPQGALYGRNAAAGAILITTREPGDEFAAGVEVGAGNNNLFKGTAWAEGPIAENLAGRITGYYRSTDGFFTNVLLNDDVVDDYEEYGVDTRFIWEPTDTMSFDFKAKYSEIDAAAIAFNASFALPGFAAFTGVPEFFENVNEHNFIYYPNIDPENEQENVNLSAKMDWELEVGTVTATLAYNDQEQYFLTDGTSAAFGIYATEPTCVATNTARAGDTPLGPPYFYVPGSDPVASLLPPYSPTTCDGYQYQVRNQEDLSFELRLASPGDQQLRWITGIYLADIQREVIVAQGADLNQGFVRQAYNPPNSISPTDLLYWDDFDNQVWAVFGQIAYDVTDDVELALALRYDEEEREVSNNVPPDAIAPFIGGGTAPINPAFRFASSIPDRSITFEQLQPKLSVNWNATDNVSAYATWGVGFRSGGFNSQGSAATIQIFYRDAFGATLFNVNDQYDKEVNESFEVGVKTEWLDRRLRVNAAAYTTDVEDMQFFNFFAGPFGLLRVVTSIDEVTIQGAEVDFEFAMTDNFDLYGGFSVLDGEIEENANRPYTVGNEVPYAPDSTYHLGGQLTLPVTTALDFIARLDWTGVGETWFHAVQEDQQPTLFGAPSDFSRAQRDAYDVVNLRLSLRAENWTVTAWSTNLTDEEYLQEVIQAPEFGGSFVHDSPRRAYGLDVRYRF